MFISIARQAATDIGMYSWLSFNYSSASLGSDGRSQASCTTEYEGDVENAPLMTDYQGQGDSRTHVSTEQLAVEEYRDPRLPSPAKVRWLKAYHKVKQIIRSVSSC